LITDKENATATTIPSELHQVHKAVLDKIDPR